jgi:hypothetical protein
LRRLLALGSCPTTLQLPTLATGSNFRLRASRTCFSSFIISTRWGSEIAWAVGKYSLVQLEASASLLTRSDKARLIVANVSLRQTSLLPSSLL